MRDFVARFGPDRLRRAGHPRGGGGGGELLEEIAADEVLWQAGIEVVHVIQTKQPKGSVARNSRLVSAPKIPPLTAVKPSPSAYAVFPTTHHLLFVLLPLALAARMALKPRPPRWT
jgi:hypothetical protein